ncbi:MAG: phosphoglycerate mutase family protein [Saprospiraceae bacterium]|nr:phosphoglycerate mutase family protein [Saprospiraceae bacterium]
MKLLKILIIGLIIFFSIPTSTLNAQSDQNIFLVRHAEKGDDGTRDPDLNGLGDIRAKKLAMMLKSFDISKIYSTDYKRTRNTAQPLAEALGITVELYDPRSKDILNKIDKLKGNILIVGHSNSTPTLTNAILGEKRYEQLDEKEYSTLFILSRVNGAYGGATSKF